MEIIWIFNLKVIYDILIKEIIYLSIPFKIYNNEKYIKLFNNKINIRNPLKIYYFFSFSFNCFSLKVK